MFTFSIVSLMGFTPYSDPLDQLLGLSEHLASPPIGWLAVTVAAWEWLSAMTFVNGPAGLVKPEYIGRSLVGAMLVTSGAYTWGYVLARHNLYFGIDYLPGIR